LDGLQEALDLAFTARVVRPAVDDRDAELAQCSYYLEVGFVGVVGVVA
jgi:hypothetical protein